MEAQPLTWAVHHLAVAVAEFDASVARRLGLSAGDYLALKHLLAAAGPVEFADPPGPVELGRLLGLSSGAATGLVDRLERAGYARREPHPRDRRRQIVRATARAEADVVRALEPVAAEIDRIGAGLTDEQRELTVSVLGALAAVHRAQDPSPS
ncbi:MarR family winged helix-turn-helix transcriptional regulator [Cryptosporangium arvum]|uniref:MarR family winged helix-turn-helix transcriptional regulator n=1 Tax=Cryptosporangium arvum TaxID=80871 RepID=UPI0004B1ABE1|nr:MarR family transcriptional regulator [Cryptosporangium arvum]